MPAEPCGYDRPYLAIIITIVPYGVVFTLMVVLALMAFHKSIRAAKIYDNCTSSSANYVYHIELRTGETSATYNRRKSTISIDMFDENQTTLARIAVPGHIIFGRKESPIDSVEDERFIELRVTRLWLYRASRLKRVSTIRLTHTCTEPEARIMIYGMELRTDDEERPRLFFPVMSYITSFGTESRPNACYDADPLGTISALGYYPDNSPVSDRLAPLDYGLLLYLFCGLVIYVSTLDFFVERSKDKTAAAYKGAMLGCIGFAFTFLIGIFMRYVLRTYYSLSVGRGFWAIMYYVFAGLILLVSSVMWMYATYLGYKTICSTHFDMWLLTLCVAAIESAGFVILCATAAWMLVPTSAVYAEQFVIPEDPSASGGSGKADSVPATTGARKTTQSIRSQQQDPYRPKSPLGSAADPGQSPRAPTVAAVGAAAVAHPWQATSAGAALPVNMLQPPPPINYSHGNLYGPQSPYMLMGAGQPMSPGTGAVTTFKVPFTPPASYPPGFDTAAGHYGAAQAQSTPPYGHYGPSSPVAAHGTPPPPPHHAPVQQQQQQQPQQHHHHGTAATTTPATAFHTMQLKPTQKHQHHQHAASAKPATTYHQQMGAASAGKQPTVSASKKVGSQESTGSTYYQQLMKNKGGVKSISQYGELLKKNKK